MKLRVFRGDGAFQRAAGSKTETQQVCGTYVGDAPTYFLMPADATDADIRAAAFRIREGREISEAELEFIAAVERHDARRARA